jgi:hypothetical protein
VRLQNLNFGSYLDRNFGTSRARGAISVDEQTARSKNGPEPSSRLEFQMVRELTRFMAVVC